MLIVTRKFKIEIFKDRCEEFESKLDELCVQPNFKHSDGLFRVEYFFTESQQTMCELMNYLHNEYKGTANIIY